MKKTILTLGILLATGVVGISQTLFHPGGPTGQLGLSGANEVLIKGNNRTVLRVGGPTSSNSAIGDVQFIPNGGGTVGGLNSWTWSFRSDAWSGFVGDLALYSYRYKNSMDVYSVPFIAQADGDVILVAKQALGGIDGNVGIGTITPEEKLTVTGNVKLINKGRIIFDGTQRNWNTWKGGIEGPMGTAWVTSTANSDGYYTGIGMMNSGFYYGKSRNPISKLPTPTDIKYMFSVDLDGKLTTREVEVSFTGAGGWPDFVFNKEYDLQPLSEVEKFIEENNHLPNVPSEKEVQEDGINLGEMDAILLRKIEELTLYILDQDKRIQQLEKGK